MTATTIAPKYFAGTYYSDVAPFEVVRVVSGKTIEVRQMDAESRPVAATGQQAWDITSNEGNPLVRIRWTKRGWRSADGMRYWPTEQPYRYYDWSF